MVRLSLCHEAGTPVSSSTLYCLSLTPAGPGDGTHGDSVLRVFLEIRPCRWKQGLSGLPAEPNGELREGMSMSFLGFVRWSAGELEEGVYDGSFIIGGFYD